MDLYINEQGMYYTGDMIPGDRAATPKEAAAYLSAAEARVSVAQAKTEASSIIMARVQRQMAQEGEFTPEEMEILAKAGLFPEWTLDEEYIAGNRVSYNGAVYEVMEPVVVKEGQTPESLEMQAKVRAATEKKADGKLEGETIKAG